MTTSNFDREIVAALTDLTDARYPEYFDEAVERAVGTRQRPAWTFPGRWLPAPLAIELRPQLRPAAIVLLVVSLITTLLVGGMIAGGWFDNRVSVVRPSPVATPTEMPSDSATPSPLATPHASVAPTSSHPQGLVAYTVRVELQPGQGGCGPLPSHACLVKRLWIANADGTNPHELMPGGFDDQKLIAWSPDGSRLVYGDDFATLALTDAQGSAPQVISGDSLCRPAGNCMAREFFSFSPDGTRLAYVFGTLNPPLSSVIAIYDLATGQITALQSTSTTYAGRCDRSGAEEGENDYVEWSPDGSRLVFGRQGVGPPEGDVCRSAIFIVNVDDSGLRQIVPTAPGGLNPRWSPDGSLIVFHANDGVYTVRPDGSGLRQLTTEGAWVGPRWTADGRIVFFRVVGRDTDQESLEEWIMNADGSGQARLEPSGLADLAAVNCITCPYPVSTGSGVPDEAMWQPKP